MKSKNFGYLFVAFLLLVSCSKKSVADDTSNNGYGQSNTNAKFTKLYEGRFAVKSDGSLWGWGGEIGYDDGYKIPKKILQGGIKDFKNGYVVKDDGTLWQLGKQNFLDGSYGCGPFSGRIFNTQGYYNQSFKQIGSDANWTSVGVKNNGRIYNVVTQPVFSYIYWPGPSCRGWWRDLNYYGVGWQADATFNDWKYTNISASIGLRSNGTLYAVGFKNPIDKPQLTSSDLIKTIDNNVSEVINEQYGILYKKNDGTLWQATPDYGNYIKTQISGVWKSISGFYIANTNQRFIGIKVDGTLWAWGVNYDGFLGDGTYTTQVSPVKISDKTNWLQVSTENAIVGSFTVLDSDGNIYGWGKNNRGQLGDGTTTDKYKPTLVIRSS